MPIIGTGTFIPQPKWTLTRAYASAVAFPDELTLESSTDGHFVFNDFALYNDRIHCVINPKFWSWSSNRYTLDYVVTEAYYFPLPSTTPLPFNFTVSFIPQTPTQQATIFVRVLPFSSTPHRYPLPSPGVPYWRPAL